MATEKILIIAKTYPTPSTKYDETVCTAGIRKDGSWVRLYPIPFRKLDFDKQYKKFQWIEVDIERNQKDPRLESYRLRTHDNIRIVGEVPPDKDGTWHQRRILLLQKVYTNRTVLVADAYAEIKPTSLAIFKPSKFLKFIIEADPEREWKKSALDAIKARAQQVDLFMGAQNPFEVVSKIPYKFSYKFTDDEGKESTLQIIDWEIGNLFRNCLRDNSDNDKIACQKVQLKYWDDFAKKKDTFLVLGTTLEHHLKKALNPFVIISVFPPKHELQARLEL
jgi:hypothetical protein